MNTASREERMDATVLRELRAIVGADHVRHADGDVAAYALVRPRDSRRILAAKLDEIEAAGIDYMAVVNPGCYRQLEQGLRRRKSVVRVAHLAELAEPAELAELAAGSVGPADR